MTGAASLFGFFTQTSFLPCFRHTKVRLFDSRSAPRFVQRLPAMLLAFGDGSKEMACGSNRFTKADVEALLTSPATGGATKPLATVHAATAPTKATFICLN